MELHSLSKDELGYLFSFLPRNDLRNVWKIYTVRGKYRSEKNVNENTKVRRVVLVILAKLTIAYLPKATVDAYCKEKKIIQNDDWKLKMAKAVYYYRLCGCDTKSRNDKALKNKEILACLPRDLLTRFLACEKASERLIDCALRGNQAGVIKELAKDKVWINAVHRIIVISYGGQARLFPGRWMTALMSAANMGYDQIVELLLEKGADVNATDCHGNTALMHAAENGHLKIVELLLKYEPDDRAIVKAGICCMRGKIHRPEHPDYHQIQELLLERRMKLLEQRNAAKRNDTFDRTDALAFLVAAILVGACGIFAYGLWRYITEAPPDTF